MFAFALALAIQYQSEVTNTEVVLKGMNSDSWRQREKSTDEMRKLFKKSPIPISVVNRKLIKNELSLEVRRRLSRIFAEFHGEAYRIRLSIWSLPDKYRYVGKRDVALYYYKLAQSKRGYIYEKYCGSKHTKAYNDVQLMQYATQLYFCDWLEAHRSKVEMCDLTNTMAQNFYDEAELSRKYIKDVYMFGSFGSFTCKDVPKSFKERMEGMKAKLKTGEDRNKKPDMSIFIPPSHIQFDAMECYCPDIVLNVKP